MLLLQMLLLLLRYRTKSIEVNRTSVRQLKNGVKRDILFSKALDLLVLHPFVYQSCYFMYPVFQFS